ncbi:hypothetical protein Z042_10595 [Chania multitudinisentens RB-25]|uniref:Fimbrial-type adhesion domain-containing protein n=1 Tax=Chania multitudinisentens RB-25 TaxID=1441930 RepID=W0LFV3_9GAMM|nr:fimbrial protein [Chania multitudinisentens]AHG22743.1 hypothetical protein Z042_10595 [Chania multitudinisentens RB-25]
MIKRINTLALLTATLLAPPLWAADGIMKFNGKVTENTCVLEAKDLTVDLGTIAAVTNLSGATGAGRFTIQLNDCPASSNQARIRFEGVLVDSSFRPGTVFAFSNQNEDGAAQNVGFTIDSLYANNPIPVGGESKLYTLETGTGSINKLEFSLGFQRIKSNAPVTPGMATGDTQFSIIYP